MNFSEFLHDIYNGLNGNRYLICESCHEVDIMCDLIISSQCKGTIILKIIVIIVGWNSYLSQYADKEIQGPIVLKF